MISNNLFLFVKTCNNENMTKIIFSVMFPLLQILYQVKVPLKIGCCKKKKKNIYSIDFFSK